MRTRLVQAMANQVERKVGRKTITQAHEELLATYGHVMTDEEKTALDMELMARGLTEIPQGE